MFAQSQDWITEKAAMKLEKQGLENKLKQAQERNAHIEQELEKLNSMFLELKRNVFGTRSERWIDKNQDSLFNEAEVESTKPEDADDSETVTVAGFKRSRGKRKPLPENLPRQIVTVELPESERFAEDGTPLKVIGKEVSEKLVYEPAHMEVVEYHRLRYGVDSGDPIKTAPPVPSIIPKGIATPSLLAGIVIHKYSDGLPLYRQEEMFGRIGVEMSRGSMARWIVQAAAACVPIHNLLQDRLLASSYVSCDETYTQVLKENGRKTENQSWMWVRATPADPKKIVLFDYDPHRSAAVANRLFADYRGYLQVDGYGSYNALEKREGITRIGCNMHGRRGFEKARKQGAKTGHSLAEQGLKFYKKIYDIEEEAKSKGMNPAERYEYRKAKAIPIWDEMKNWATDNAVKVPPKSHIGKALGYFLGEYDTLVGYLKDGLLEADNGFAERAIRKFAIGRNNWMFSDTPEGAQASALFYSLVVTAKINGVNPYLALKQIFEQLPLAKTVEAYELLTDLLFSPAKSH
jgi:transposase